MNAPVLRLSGFGKHFGSLRVFSDIDLDVMPGDRIAILGASGSGKSTLLRCINVLETPSEGSLEVDGDPVGQPSRSGDMRFSERELCALRQRVGMVFQQFNLFPHMTVAGNVAEGLKTVRGVPAQKAQERAVSELQRVGLADKADTFPSRLSGGQKQRVGIARAFAGDARIVVADEPVSALDVSVQAAVTDLLMEIQREQKTTLLFISHDLSIVRYLSDRVMVMYLGHVVELGSTDQVFAPPYHPYTEALLSAVPIADTSVEKKHIVLEGDIPSAMNPPPGCPFQTRCRWKSEVAGGLCEKEVPPVRQVADGHQIKCHLSSEALDRMEAVIKLAAD